MWIKWNIEGEIKRRIQCKMEIGYQKKDGNRKFSVSDHFPAYGEWKFSVRMCVKNIRC